ncbi:MAG: alpha/beta fold hydrolase [Pseudomonadota bacterium]
MTMADDQESAPTEVTDKGADTDADGAGEFAAEPRDQVVLVHGLWMTGAESVVLRRRLSQLDFGVRQFSYRSVRDGLAENARQLHAFTEEIDSERLHLVGHSLGGLVILRLLAEITDFRPGRVVLLGSPLQGSEVADRLAQWPFGEQVLGRSIADDVLASPKREWDGSRDLGIIAGSKAVGMGRVVTKLRRPNDGTVTVAETRLPGAKAHRVLPVTHSTLLFSSLVADHIARFLREGRFPPKAKKPKTMKNEKVTSKQSPPQSAAVADDTIEA